MSSLALVVLALTVGQTDAEQAFSSFADFMVGGTWTRTAEDGKHEIVYTRILNDNFVHIVAKDPQGGWAAIAGVDRDTGKMTLWLFGSNAGTGVVTTEKTGPNEWTQKGVLHNPDGKMSFSGVLTRIGDDEMRYKTPDSEHFWKRKAD
jgi:hypothetical protein